MRSLQEIAAYVVDLYLMEDEDKFAGLVRKPQTMLSNPNAPSQPKTFGTHTHPNFSCSMCGNKESGFNMTKDRKGGASLQCADCGTDHSPSILNKH